MLGGSVSVHYSNIVISGVEENLVETKIYGTGGVGWWSDIPPTYANVGVHVCVKENKKAYFSLAPWFHQQLAKLSSAGRFWKTDGGKWAVR